ncbi:hypothetical protein cypCar_00028417 [Cyprinus carpio]|nr:hypothetical protein cypCar_00028417 [Cyprinus carpio]
MAALISENFKFVAIFFKSKDVMIFNGLIGLGTVASQTVYNIFAFHCPCSPKKNYLYGLAAIGVPALAFFIIGVMLNQNTWDVVSECRTRKCRKLSVSAAFALLGSILGRAVVAPITWSVISLLRGEAYVCAFSEFIDPSSLDHFPPTTKTPEIMALFPCKDVPAPFMNYSRVIQRQLKYESQQEAYWSQYRSSEQTLFQRTADVHAKYLAAECVKSFFGFVALEDQEKQLLADCKGIKSVIPRKEWNRVTGVYMYRETNDTPIYSRLNKWDMCTKENNC